MVQLKANLMLTRGHWAHYSRAIFVALIMSMWVPIAIIAPLGKVQQ